MSFQTWMNDVDNLCVKVIDLSINDLRDFSWRSNYDDGLSPGTALYYFLEEEGFVARYPELLSQYIEQSEIT